MKSQININKMQEEDQKSKELKDKKLRTKIKKDINMEDFDKLRVSYSYLDKKNKSGFGSNLRVFFIIHKECIGYINDIDKKILLPFGSKQNVPKLKDSILLTDLEKVENQKQMLSIAYKKDGKIQNWEFKCPSIDSAKNWAKKINYSITEKSEEQKNPPQQIIVENKIGTQVMEHGQQKIEPVKGVEVIKEVEENEKEQKKEHEEKLNTKNEPINEIQQKAGEQTEQKDAISSLAALLGQKQEEKVISKPQSSFFVGSVAVKTEKDQNQLKQKIEVFSGKGLKFKDQYEKKKQQQKKMKKQIIQQNGGGLLGGLLMMATNTKLQIQKMKKQWGYEFAKSQNEYQIVEDFKNYITAVMRKIVDQLGLEEKKRYYQPSSETSNCLKYEISGVQLNLFLAELKQINSIHEKGTMVTNQEAKMAAHEFKNFEYILRLTHNKGKIRVPLSMMIEYKGFTAFAKVIIPSTEVYENMELLEKQLEILEAESRVNNSLFQDPQCGKIVALQSKVYEKLARAQNFNKKFDICYVDALRYYLPHDFNNFSKDRPYNRLRKQLLQDDECEDKILYGEDMVSLSSRLKLPQNYRDGINELTEISQTIYERINILALELESTDLFFSNSHEISKIMHRYGINMRYLGVLLEKVKVSWLKEIIMAEICARCAKNFLLFDLQDCLLNLSEANDEAVRKFQIKQVINFLNKMLGNSQDSQTFWKQMNRQSQSYFKISIDKEEINQGFLIQALQTHCNFKLNSLDQQIVLFDSPAPFSVSHFSCFEVRTKVYDLSFTEMYSSIRSIISEQSTEAYDQLRVLLNFNRSQHIPDHFKMSGAYDQIIKFLVNWLSPYQARDVYYPEEIQLGENLPSLNMYQIKLAEIRWGLKEGKLEESQKVKEWMIDHINKWIGDAHPILTELYEIYANYHLLHKDQQKKSVNYCKTAIRNQEKLLGASHQKLADNYYLLGTVYLNYGKKAEAVNTLNKAKQIILKSQNQNSEAFGEVSLKMGQLLLSVNEPKKAVEEGLSAMKIFTDTENSISLIQAIELVCRCYEVLEDWQSYFSLIQSTLIHKVADFSDEVEALQKIIKVAIFPSLKTIAQNNATVAQRILKVMNELPDTTRAPNMAYNFLKLRIEEKVFPHKFLEILNDIEDVLEEIQSNGMIARWKGFQNLSNKSLLNKIGINMGNRGFNFIASLEALNIFIGSSYVEGVLMDL